MPETNAAPEPKTTDESRASKAGPRPGRAAGADAARVVVGVDPALLDDAVVRQVRDRLDPEAVGRYRDAYLGGVALPPVRAFSYPAADGTTAYLLGDGGHRKRAAADAGLAAVPCSVTACVDAGEAERRAFAHAARSNATHGVPRSDADKRKTVRAAVLRPEFFPPVSDRKVGRACRVTKFLVRKVRLALARAGELPDPARRNYKPRPGDESDESAVTTPVAKGGGTPVAKGGAKGNAAKAAAGPPVDNLGEPVPANLAAVFAARAWFQSAATRLGQLDKEARAAAAAPHGLALAGVLDDLALDLEDAALTAARASPHAVCPACKGAAPGGTPPGAVCGHCDGWGWLTRDRYDDLPGRLKHAGDGGD